MQNLDSARQARKKVGELISQNTAREMKDETVKRLNTRLLSLPTKDREALIEAAQMASFVPDPIKKKIKN